MSAASGISAPLEVSAERLGSAYDLLAAYGESPEAGPSFFMERSGIGVAGAVSVRISIPAGARQVSRAARDVSMLLASVRHRDGHPRAVVAGALPFDGRSAPATLGLLGSCVVRAESGAAWRLRLRPIAGEGSPDVADGFRKGRSPAAAPGDAFGDDQIRAVPDPSAYGRAIEDATRRIHAGVLRKVVLARALDVAAGRDLDPRTLLARLRAVDPDCFTFATPSAFGVLVGASPELLVARDGDVVRANPLAGSSPRFGDADDDRASAHALLSSPKDREEHAIVARDVVRRLAPFCEALHVPDQPELLGTANVWHLSTPIRGRLRRPAATALELVAALHPTPAVCGMPRRAAARAIKQLEPFERGCYAGPVGWTDADGDGQWALALRCAELRGAHARLFAGAGIVAGSRPQGELDETDRKFRALVDALRWG
jgi:isochorismate synthase